MKIHHTFRLLYKLPLLALFTMVISCSADEEPVAEIQQVEEQEAQAPKQAVVESQEDTIYTFVDQMPVFQGGEAEMMKYLGENVRYPEEAKEAGLEGIVVASLVVEKDGTVSDIQVVKDLGMGTDEEVLRVIKKTSGKWEPGTQAGEPVRFRYTLPVRFAIK